MRNTLFAGRLPILAVALATAAACSQAPQSPTSPSAALGGALADSHGGATLKVAAPVPISPTGGVTIDDRKPVFIFQNAAGLFVLPDSFGVYEVEVFGPNGGLVARHSVPGDPGGGTSLAYDDDLEWETNYTWRVRKTLDGAAGPWSAPASFRTPDEPAAILGFDIPASCGPIAEPMSNRLGCVHEIGVLSDYWADCTGRGDKVACHRFTRQVAAALAVGDPRWGLITKNPGDFQCTWDRCWSGDGSGYGEDVVAFHYGPGPANWEGFDIIVAAGLKGASMGWARLEGKRPGNHWAPVPPF
jgi:hypothetical protein